MSTAFYRDSPLNKATRLLLTASVGVAKDVVDAAYEVPDIARWATQKQHGGVSACEYVWATKDSESGDERVIETDEALWEDEWSRNNETESDSYRED